MKQSLQRLLLGAVNTLEAARGIFVPSSHAYVSIKMKRANPNLRKKMDPTGKILPYVGNTVVFLLDDNVKAHLHQLQKSLYQAAPDMLAEPLQMSTFHMTLHDLANGTPDQWGLSEYMQDAEHRAATIISQWENRQALHMKATWLFNMVNTSIVLGFTPADEESWRRLDEMYTTLEDVVHLGYALTPHITVGYFRPGTYSQELVQQLSSALRNVDLDVSLSMEHLVLQNFTDMNNYETAL